MRVTSRRPSVLVALGVVAGVLVVTTCQENAGPRVPSEPRVPALASVAPPGSVVLVGAGDISLCTHHNDTSTAKLLDTIAGTVFTTGDNVGSPGDSTTYANCYNPTWGRQKARTYPAPGDVEYLTAGAPGYYGYFGTAAGDPTKGYYSYNLGSWHIIVLNSQNSSAFAAGSAQEQWLKADLAANPSQCTLAYWHYPLFYSGTSTVRSWVQPIWNDLYAAGATLVLNSHTRNYERFAPQSPTGVLDTTRGIREFIVGTGGLGNWSFYTIAPNSEVRAQVYGVLKLTLSPGTYRWQFIPIAGTQFSDTGSGSCKGPSGPPPPPPPPTPSVNAGADLGTYLGTPVNLSIAFSDTGTNDAPWTYNITWGDGTSTTGSASSASTPIAASHNYTALGLDSVRVSVTNSAGRAGWDTVSVRVMAPGTQVVLFGGDIADCSNSGRIQTAALLDTIAGIVIAGGDNAYPAGDSTDYANCYAPTWGRQLFRTYAAIGNHDYGSGTANPSWNYFGAAAGPRGLGYYSFDIGSWHVVVLNSNYTSVPTAVGSAQELWLKSDLAGASGKCILAVWHHPRFYSSTSSPLSAGTSTLPFWNDLYAAHADLILNGHMHDYERFAQTDPSGNLDLANGIREIIAGTGGGGLDGPNTVFWPNSQVRISGVFGVLKLTLSSTAYSWQFIPVAGQTASDSGTTTCHNAGAAVNHPPTAAPGGPYTGSEGTAISFTGSASSDPDGDALTYAWSFGDGMTGTGIAPSHVYADNGSYTVSLTVTDSKGAASAPATTTASVANVAPVVTLPANQTATAGSAYALSATFADAGVNDSPWGYSINWGDGTAPTTGSATSQSAAITASHTYAAGGTDTVRVTVTDKDGGAGAAKTPVSVAAANRPPTASPGGPYTGNEGSAVTFNGSGSADPQGSALTYAWGFGDGATGTGVSPTHTYADNGSYTVTLTVTDALGLSSSATTTTATIANLVPVVTLPASQSAVAGSAFSLSATFSDAGVNDAPWTYSINWGDGSAATTGSTPSQSSAITASHTYAASGTDTVRVTVTDKDGGAGTAKTPVGVAAAPSPPTAAPGGPYAGNEGSAVAFNGSGSTDPQGSALTYGWSFGDGTTATGVSPTHAYADNGSYTVTLTVTDALSLSSSPATTTATIANVAPTVSAPASLAATAGTAVTLSATFSDPGVNDAPWTYSINWGDGSAATTGSTTSQTGGISASHTYAAGGTDTATVTVTDKDAGVGTAKTAIAVAAVNHPPTAVAGGPYAGNEGAAIAFNGSGSSDPDGDAITYAWSFGDGTTGTGATPSHAYADNGSYTVTLTVTDAKGAASPPASATATIANVAPTVNVPASLAATAGSPVALAATFSDPGTRDSPWSYTINWGDGTAFTTGSVTSQTGITAAHTYAAAGSNTATVTVTDKDGGSGSGQTLVTVAQPVTSVTLVGAGNIARCDRTNDEATAALLDGIAGTVFALGDNAYPNGTAANFTCYDASWGRHKARTYPAVGNHEYDSSTTAASYFNYFGAAAGSAGLGYYSYDLGAWHIVVLNSNNANVSTAVGSPQETWLKADLAATTKRCVLAMFHHPRFYSTTATSFFPTASVKPFWDDLYAAGAELIINAHMQDYERFAPQNSAGTADPNGIREIIVGTGGSGLDAPNTLITANSEARISGVYGVVKLTLSDGSYSWQFIPVAGQTGADSGSGSCH
jgi:PKD repeat protein